MPTSTCLVFALHLLLKVVSCDYDLTVIHVNDFHAHFDQFDRYNSNCDVTESQAGECYGGLPRLFTAVQRVRESSGNLIYLNGGDEYQGTLWFNQFKYRPYVQFLSLLGYDAMALGNHEFDWGVEELIPLLDGVNFTIVGSNIDYSNEQLLSGKNLAKSVVLQKGLERIGVIGFTTTDTPGISFPGDNLKFNDEVPSIQQEATKLKNQGVKIIIALGHSGFEIDKKIAREVKEVDIVVGGHTNTFLYTGTPPAEEDKDKVEGPYPVVIRGGKRSSAALVVQDYSFAKYLGFLQVTFDRDGDVLSWSGNPILLDNSVERDNGIMELMQPYRDELMKKGREKICENESPLGKEECRDRECALGNLMVDAIRDWYRHEGDTDIIALWNGGGMRNDIGSGTVRYTDVISTYPFENTVNLYKIKGEHLKAVFEQSADKWKSGGFLQVSGLRVVLDVSKPSGEKVVSLHTCNECGEGDESIPIDPNKEYSVATSKFLRRGGNYHTALHNNTIAYKNQDFLDLDIILKYLRKKKVLDKEEILDCRILLRGVKQDNPACISSSEKNLPVQILLWTCLAVIVILKKIV